MEEGTSACGDLIFPKAPNLPQEEIDKILEGQTLAIECDKITQSESLQIEFETRQQSTSKRWLDERKKTYYDIKFWKYN